MHVVVVDEDGSASGIAGNVLEKHLYLSKAKDGKRQPAEEVYYKTTLQIDQNTFMQVLHQVEKHLD